MIKNFRLALLPLLISSIGVAQVHSLYQEQLDLLPESIRSSVFERINEDDFTQIDDQILDFVGHSLDFKVKFSLTSLFREFVSRRKFPSRSISKILPGLLTTFKLLEYKSDLVIPDIIINLLFIFKEYYLN